MNMLKRCTAFILFQLVFLFSSMAQDGHSLLANALQASKKASFSTSMKNPFPKATLDKDILPYGTDWKFYRLYKDDKTLYLRLDILAKDQTIETYVKNADGIYGLAADGFAAKIIEVPVLWVPESTHLDISREELELSSYSVYQTSYNNTPCYRIIMKTPQDSDTLMKITGEDQGQFNKNRQRYYSKRVFYREFWIGQNNSFIYCRRHYNNNGKLIFSVELGNVSFADTFPKETFATPKNVKGQFIERNFFASRALAKMLNDRKPSFFAPLGQWFEKTWENIWNHFDVITMWLTPIFILIAVSSIVFLAVIKYRNRS